MDIFLFMANSFKSQVNLTYMYMYFELYETNIHSMCPWDHRHTNFVRFVFVINSFYNVRYHFIRF